MRHCKGIVPGTFVVCGEDPDYACCSIVCWSKLQLHGAYLIGEPFGQRLPILVPDTLIVPPSLYHDAQRVLGIDVETETTIPSRYTVGALNLELRRLAVDAAIAALPGPRRHPRAAVLFALYDAARSLEGIHDVVDGAGRRRKWLQRFRRDGVVGYRRRFGYFRVAR